MGYQNKSFSPLFALIVLLASVATTLSCSSLLGQDKSAPATPATKDAAPATATQPQDSADSAAQTKDAKAANDQPSQAQAKAQAKPKTESDPKRTPKDPVLRFTFEGTPWRDVIKWIAEQGDLALHLNDMPTGSFTYTDSSPFTHEEAVDRINLFLLPQNYTLVRSGKLLSVINLGDPRSAQQLDALAKLVSSKELEALKPHQVVKCIFPLGDVKAEDAVAELAPLRLMTTPAIFGKTNQLMITDTAAKLRAVQLVLSKFDSSKLKDGMALKTFPLKHVNAEDLLIVLRPHLGLATGEMIGIDISLSSDLTGKNIFASGDADRVKIVEGLVNSLDKADATLSTEDGKAELKAHQIRGGNVESIYNVLLTLLAGKPARLSMDKKAGTVIALTSPEIQKEIEATIEKVEGKQAEFDVIQLKVIDPYFAISLLEQMLELGPDEYYSEDSRDRNDEEEARDIPKIDADPANRRLFVRAKKYQIDQIKQIIAKLDVDTNVGQGLPGDNRFRLLPLRGKSGRRTLDTAAKFWREANPVILFGSPDAEEVSERVPNGDSPAKTAASDQDSTRAKLLTPLNRSQAPLIRCQFTTRGLLLQCDDPKSLDKFEKHLRSISGPLMSTASTPVVFYLKFTKPDDALRMLAELMDGGDALRESEAGSLVNGLLASQSYLGSIVTSRDGTLSMVTGSTTIVADTRLNRLIAQGPEADIEHIERYLKIVDKDSSITEIETFGTSNVIELKNSRATEVATVLRDAFATRVTAATSQTGPGATRGAAQGSGQGQQPQPRSNGGNGRGDDERRSDNRGDNGRSNNSKNANNSNKRGGSQARDLTPKMTIAVHEPSNSLIVTAPAPLLRQVEALVKVIDARSEQSVQFIKPANAAAVRALLEQSVPSAGTSSGTSSSSNSRPSTNAPSRSPSTRQPTRTQNRSPFPPQGGSRNRNSR